jgi:hypothetical protein
VPWCAYRGRPSQGPGGHPLEEGHLHVPILHLEEQVTIEKNTTPVVSRTPISLSLSLSLSLSEINLTL